MKKFISLITAGAIFMANAYAQRQEDKIRSTGFPIFPKIVNTDIPGAPLLGQPQLIKGTHQDIRTEKHGLIYPLLYDWNKDGKPDLLLGEFETGQKGSDIKVYLNEGTAKKPKFSGKYFYATDINGDTMTTHQWCCIGTHPRLADLNNDGIMDMLSGQYNPGKINWWPGTKNGFAPRRFVEQEGYVEGEKLNLQMEQLDPKSLLYWNYTSAGFADLNGDGLADLLVGGAGGTELRAALNVGTAEKPKFGLRKYLLHLDGLPLSVVPPSKIQLEYDRRNFRETFYAGVEKSFMTPVDWDSDGVLDLLVTHMYDDSSAKDPVVFFRGIQTDKGLRFDKAKPLFTADQAKKTFPGCQPNITVADYNGDGVMDLIIGVSLPTIHGFQIDSLLAWSFLRDIDIEAPGKDAGRAIEYEGSLENLINKVESDENLKKYYLGNLNDFKYLTTRHRGYLYVMLGKKNPVKANPVTIAKAKDEVKIVGQVTAQNQSTGPVKFKLTAPAAVSWIDSGSIEVAVSFDEGWYGYAETPGNIAAQWVPTKVSYEFPDGFEKSEDPVVPKSIFKGGTDVYKGKNLKFVQKFMYTGKGKDGRNVPPGEKEIRVIVNYQTCDEEKCLPPEAETFTLKILVRQ